MAKDNNRSNGMFEKYGYCPMNVGYVPNELLDFVPAWPGSHLPKAPRGGTGESTLSPTPPVPEQPDGQ